MVQFCCSPVEKQHISEAVTRSRNAHSIFKIDLNIDACVFKIRNEAPKTLQSLSAVKLLLGCSLAWMKVNYTKILIYEKLKSLRHKTMPLQ